MMMAPRRPPPPEDSGPETEPMTIAALADRIDGLHVELRVELTAALQQGIISAASDPDTWAAAIRGMRSATERHAGRLMFGVVWGTLRRVAAIVAIGMLIYSIGGWTALSGLLKSAFESGGQ